MMANPSLETLTADTWTKVATAVTNGNFLLKSNSPAVYYYTYVDTGGAAPAGLTLANQIPYGSQLVFKNSDSSDVYIYAKGAVGSIEVQL